MTTLLQRSAYLNAMVSSRDGVATFFADACFILMAPRASEGRTRNNPAMVGVIDGSTVLLTPFRHRVVPPPMSTSAITLPNAYKPSGRAAAGAGAGGAAGEVSAGAGAPLQRPSVVQLAFAPHGVAGQ